MTNTPMLTYITEMSRAVTTWVVRGQALVLTSVLMAACSGSDTDGPLPPQGDDDLQPSAVQAGFYITIGDVVETSAQSGRAPSTPAGGYEEGNDYENYFDIAGGDYKFLFFTGDETNPTYITEFEVNSVTCVGGTVNTKRYQVMGHVPQRLLNPESFRIMVLANWGGEDNYPTFTRGKTIEETWTINAEKMIYGFSAEKMKLSATNPIPLYGIKKFEKIEFDANDFCFLGTIHLLRAYAKVDVELKDPRWALKSVELTRWRSTGYKAPKEVYDQADYVHNNYWQDYTQKPWVPSMDSDNSTVNLKSDLMFNRVNDADSTLWRGYVPEFVNLDANGDSLPDDRRARLRVRFTDRHTGLESFLGGQYISFKYYQAPDGHDELQNKHFNIMRNYWYKFTLTKGNEVSDLTVKVDVQPYAEVKLEPSFGLERDPIDGYIVLKKGMIDGKIEPTFLYDDRFDEYYDFQKYILISNYSAHITRISEEMKAQLNLTGDIWLIKRANGEHDQIGSNSGTPSLFYDADSGMYFDYEGSALNLVYSDKLLFGGDITKPLTGVMPDSVVEVDRDFEHNDIALLRGESDRVAVYYDFSDGKYKGATDFDLSDRPRRELVKHQNGWIEVKPYEAMMQKWVNNGSITSADKANVKPMYFNIYTERFYDTEFYSLHSPGYIVEYYVDSPIVNLKKGDTVIKYNRVTGVYLNAAGTVISRPSDLRYTRVTPPAGL